MKMASHIFFYRFINPLALPGAGAPALKYGYVNTLTPSPGEVKGLRNILIKIWKII